MDHSNALQNNLEQIAYYDSFLEIPNRAACLKALEELFSERKKKGFVLKLNLENFKLFNDTFGHEYGDLLLKTIANYLYTQSKGKTYRYNGVEFLMILEGQKYADMDDFAEEVLYRFGSTWKINDTDCMCAANMSAVAYPEMANDVQELLQNLEYAMEESVYRGQNQLVVFDSEILQKVHRKQSIAQLVKEAVNEESIEIRYRPTYSLEKQRFCRAESYLRLFSPEYGVIYSAEFIPIAEATGQICAINNLTIRKTCEFIAQLLKEGCDFETIAVVISPVQFLQEGFVDDVAKILEETGVPANRLAFEITESVLIDAFSACNIIMQELSDMGIEFILNDFGTGYSGVSSILSLPIDVLKLERLFVWQMESNPRSSYVIEGLIHIAQKLDMKIIAEGVETENQNEQLKAFHCDYVQGFYYSPTIEPEMLQALFLNQ